MYLFIFAGKERVIFLVLNMCVNKRHRIGGRDTVTVASVSWLEMKRMAIVREP